MEIIKQILQGLVRYYLLLILRMANTNASVIASRWHFFF